MLTLNLQHINDPLTYLRKQKLRALSLPDHTVISSLHLITPVGTRHELATNISNIELTELIQLLIDETMDALTIWCDNKCLYFRHD